jgi:DNA gyrase subunit B
MRTATPLIESIRKRPSMYLGFTDSTGIQTAVACLVDTSLAEFLAGQGTVIRVRLESDGTVEISDDGEGVRVDADPAFDGRSFLEVALTETWVDGFRSGNRASWCFPAIPTGTAERFSVETQRNGRRYQIEFQSGVITQPFRELGTASGRGTCMRWKPDPAIFGKHRLQPEFLQRHLEILASTYRGIRIEYEDSAAAISQVFESRYGFLDLLVHRDSDRSLPYPTVSIQIETGDVKFDIAFHHGGDSVIRSYVNAEPTDDGSHVKGFLRGLASCVRRFAMSRGVPGADQIDSEIVLRGLSAEVSVVADNPRYESPTKSVLHNPEIGQFVAQQVDARLMQLLLEHPSLADQLTATVAGSIGHAAV